MYNDLIFDPGHLDAVIRTKKHLDTTKKKKITFHCLAQYIKIHTCMDIFMGIEF